MGRRQRTPPDPARAAGSGTGGQDIGAEVSEARSAGPGSGPFSRAIVHEVLGDLAFRTEEDLRIRARPIGEGAYQAIKKAPRNTVLARIIAGDGAAASTGEIICYPFFPPHFSMPVKPGEQVWVFSESPDGPNPYSYWISRVHEPDHADDINYTHPERRHELYVDKIMTFALSAAEGDGYSSIVSISTRFSY